MKRIPLTQGKAALVDDLDYPYLSRFRWRFNCGYGLRTEWRGGQMVFIWLHRVIMDARPGELVDHIDGDGLNNTRANLRIVTSCSANPTRLTLRRRCRICFRSKSSR